MQLPAVVLGFLFATLMVRAEPSQLENLRSKYAAALREVQVRGDTERAALLGKYGEDLKALRAQVQGAGDLNGLQLVLAETARLENEQTLPTSTPDLPALNAVAVRSLQGQQKLNTQLARSIVTLATQYDGALETLQKALTRDGHIEDALAVQTEREQVKASDAVARARDLVASEAPATAASQPVPAEKKKLIEELKRYNWEKGGNPVPMLPDSEGFCLLTSIGGGFGGGGESVRMALNSATGRWELSGRAVQFVFAKATSVKTLLRQQFEKTTIERTWTKRDGKVRLLSLKEGFCFVSSVTGGFNGGGESIRLYVDDEGYWTMTGTSGVDTQATVAIVRIRRPRTFRADVREYEWKPGGAKLKMIHQDEGFCFISGMAGRYLGGSEGVSVSVAEDGYWYLSGTSQQSVMSGCALSVRVLPAPGAGK